MCSFYYSLIFHTHNLPPPTTLEGRTFTGLPCTKERLGAALISSTLFLSRQSRIFPLSEFIKYLYSNPPPPKLRQKPDRPIKTLNLTLTRPVVLPRPLHSLLVLYFSDGIVYQANKLSILQENVLSRKRMTLFTKDEI